MKYQIKVERTDVYEIEIDEQVWNEEALNNWSNVFQQVDDVEDLAKVLAEATMKQGSDQFIEGFGRVKTLNRDGEETYSSKICKDKDESIILTVIDEDDDYYTNIEFIEE